MTNVRRFVWRRPEWWTWAICAGAWVLLSVRPPHVQMHHHPTAWAVVVEWMLMVFAMMLPLVFAQVRATAAHSLWNRRHRAIAGFLCGYAGTWIAAGVLLAMFVNQAARSVAPRQLAVGILVLAALWELTAVRRRALSACHAMLPLAPSGWRADLDTVRYGTYVGSQCFVVCGISMVGCAMTGHSLFVMFPLTGILYGGREIWRSAGMSAAAIAMLATAIAILH